MVGGSLLAGSGACFPADTIEYVCPDVGPGDLVITEIRGEQSGPDTYGQWVEVYNASGSAIDLRGMQLEVTRLDGSGLKTVIVRADALPVEPGAYTVLGAFPEVVPDHGDYAFGVDLQGDLYGAAVLRVFACGEEIDTLVYTDLPGEGSYSLDGDLEPDTEANDDEENWCTDAAEDPDAPPNQIGTPGTPKEANRPCT